ncbi:MAG: hypothetical protein ACE5F8_01560 [Woeseiaceae bacterium]
MNRSLTEPRSMRHPAVAVAMLLLAPPAAAADDAPVVAPGTEIGSVSVVRHNVFDPNDPKESGAFYQFFNRFHVVTRDHIIRQQLLFAEGDFLDPRLLDESARILRANRYLYDASLSAKKGEDGKAHVTVETHDIWSITPELSISRKGGENETVIGLEEDNLLGLGQRIRLFRADDVDRTSTTFEFFDRQIGRSWVGVHLVASDNSDGDRLFLSIDKPFHALDARWSAGGWASDDDRETSLYSLGDEIAEFRHERRFHTGWGGWSSGLINGWVRRWTAGLVYDDNEFSTVPVPTLPAAAPEDRKLVYPYIGFELLEDDFQRTQNSDQISRSEDFFMGTRLAATVGWSDTSFGADRDALIYTLVAGKGFGSMDKTALLTSATVRGRHESGDTANATSNVKLQYYWRQSEKLLFFTLIDATVGHDLDLDSPVQIGGDSGLRGYPLRYQAGDGRVLVTVEQRYFTDWYPFRLFRVGGAIFFDAGRTFGDNPVAGPNLGWLRDVGIGLRFAPTRLSTKRVVHLDLAFPLDGEPTIDDVQILLEAKRSF